MILFTRLLPYIGLMKKRLKESGRVLIYDRKEQKADGRQRNISVI